MAGSLGSRILTLVKALDLLLLDMVDPSVTLMGWDPLRLTLLRSTLRRSKLLLESIVPKPGDALPDGTIGV